MQQYYDSCISHLMECKFKVLDRSALEIYNVCDFEFLRPAWHHAVSEAHSFHSKCACRYCEPAVLCLNGVDAVVL